MANWWDKYSEPATKPAAGSWWAKYEAEPSFDDVQSGVATDAPSFGNVQSAAQSTAPGSGPLLDPAQSERPGFLTALGRALQFQASSSLGMQALDRLTGGAGTDLATLGAGGAVTGTGRAIEGVERLANEPVREAGEVGGLLANIGRAMGVAGPAGAMALHGATRGEAPLNDAPAYQPSALSAGLKAVGEDMSGAVTPAMKQAMRDTQMDGDVLSPSTWTLGRNPSARGLLGHVAKTGGEMAPIVGTAFVNPALAVGAAAGQSASGAYEENADYFLKLPPAELAQVPLFRELVERGVAPDRARAMVADEAGRASMAPAAVIGAGSGVILSGAATRPLARAMAARFGDKFSTRLLANAVGMPLEGGQEVVESVSGRKGANTATGADRSLTEGTFADFAMGMAATGPAAITHSVGGSIDTERVDGEVRNADQERARRLVDQLDRSAQRVETPESRAVDAGREAAAAIFAEADASVPATPVAAQEAVQADPAKFVPERSSMTADEITARARATRDALNKKANGTPDQEVVGPDGKKITVRGEKPEFLRDGERQLLDFLMQNIDNPVALADRAGVKLADPANTRQRADGEPAGSLGGTASAIPDTAPATPRPEAPTLARNDARLAQLESIPEPTLFEREEMELLRAAQSESQAMPDVPRGTSRAEPAVEISATEPQRTADPEAPTNNATQERIVEIPVASLTLSDDVPQFKSGARDDGVVEPLGGTFDRRGTGPIQVWRRADGRMEVISGRHRLDLARRSGETSIPAQVYDEAQGFDARQAASLDAELNIRDGQGKVKDYVQYFTQPAFDGPQGRQAADARGLLARATGKRAYTIASQGSPDLIAAHSADRVTDEAAVQIAQAAPGDAALQALGMKLVQEGRPISIAANTMRAARSMRGDSAQSSGDMFGFDDSAIQDAVKMAGVASRKQREIAERLAAITGASKRPEIAAKEGVDVRDPQALPARIAQLRAEKAEWDDWATDPAKVAAIRAELGMPEQVQQQDAEGQTEDAQPVDDVTAPMFSRRTGGASGDMFGGATIEDTNRAAPGARMPESADLFGGPSMQDRVGAAERAKDAARNSVEGKREDTGDGGLFDGARPEQMILRSQRDDGDLDFGDRTDDQLESQYANLKDKDGNSATDYGHKIDTDLVRELSPEYRGNRRLSPRIHKAASALTGRLFARALARPVAVGREPVVFFTAGGGGSGKSTAVADVLGVQNADVTMDGTLSNLGKARDLIRDALGSGRKVRIAYVYRSPQNSVEGAIGRAISSGRPVPVDVLAEAHAKAPEVLKALALEYNGDARVEIVAIYNDGPKGTAYIMPAKEIPDVDQRQAEAVFREALDQARAEGRVDEELYSAFAGTGSRVGAEGGGRPEPQREGRGGNPVAPDAKRKEQSTTPASTGVSVSGAREAKDAAEAKVAGFWGRGAVSRLKNRGRVEFVTKAEVIERELGGLRSEDDVRGVDGFYDPETGKAYVIADSGASDADLPGVLSHEVLHANGEQFLGSDGFTKLKNAFARLRNREKEIRDAYERVPSDTKAEHVDEEALSYLAQEAPKHRFSQRLVDETKLFLNRMGIPLDWLNANAAAVRKIAALNLRDASNRDVATFNRDGVKFGRSIDDGKQRNDQTDTPEFKRWFGDSKVVDAQGRPLVVYRGDTSVRTVIEPQGGMIWLAENADYSREFAGSSGDVAALYASIERPFDSTEYGDELSLDEWKQVLGDAGVDTSNVDFEDWAPDYGRYYFYDLLPHSGNNYFNGRDTGLIGALQDAGYDGIMAAPESNGGAESGRVFVAFRPEQIKSATGNTGAFDPANPDIRFSRDTKRSAVADGVFRDTRGNDPAKRIEGATTVATPPSPEGPRLPKFNSLSEFWVDNIGKPIYDAINGSVGALMRKMQLAENLPPEARKAWREYRQRIGEAQKTVREIGGAARDLTPDEREMVSDFIEREMKAGVTPPEKVQRMGTIMSSIMRKQSDELVRLGMLSEEARDRWDGRYLPRFYAKHLATSPFSKELRRVFLQGIKGSHLKGRGMFETVDAAEVDRYKELGWEVRDGNPAKGGKVTMWKDFTPAQRQRMGEVRDAMFRFARGYTETQMDIARGNLFDQIAKTIARTDDNAGTFVQVPDTKIPGAGVRKFGNLSGMYVPREVLSQLKATVSPDSALMKAYLKGLSWWKEGKTTLNPVTHVNNVVSNVVMADLAGINLLDPRSFKLYAETFRDYAREGTAFKEAQAAGLFGNEWFGNEVAQWVPVPAEVRSAQTDAGIAAAFANKGLSIAQAGREAMGRAYQAEDQFFKLLLYKQARAKGLEPNDSVEWAERFVFDYSKAPAGVRLASRTLFPFANYTSKAIPALTFAATHYPWRIAKWVGLLSAVSTYGLSQIHGDDDEAKEAEGKLMPEYMKGGSSFFGVPKAIRLPYNTDEGDAMYVDISRFLPLGDLFDANNQMGGVPLPAPLTPNNPVITTAIAMLANKDSFTGKDLVSESDTGSEAAWKRTAWLWKQMAPNNPVVPGTHNFNRLAEAAAAASGTELGPYTGLDYNGNTISPARAVAQSFGVKLRPVDFERERGFQRSALDAELRELKSKRTKLNRNQSIASSVRERELANNEAKIEDVMRRIDELESIPSP